jgi:hypothetical protein
LGLYDTAGNLSELCLDSYKVSTGDRLQGTEGGNLLKGGNYLSPGGEVLPGSRLEIPKYSAQGETKLPYMGLRLAISSSIVTSDSRSREIKKDFDNLPDVDTATAQAMRKMASAVEGDEPPEPAQKNLESAALLALNPVDRINGLLPFIESSGQKMALSSLSRDFANYNEIRTIETKEEATARFNSVLFAAYGIRDTSLRRNLVRNKINQEQNNIELLNDSLKETRDAQQKAELQAQINQANETIAALTPSIEEFNAALDNQFAFYKASLEFLTQYSPDLLALIVNLTRNEYLDSDSYSVSMRTALDVTVRDITLFLDSQGSKVILDNVIVR